MEELKEEFQNKRKPVKEEKKAQKEEKPDHYDSVDTFLEELDKVWKIRGGRLEQFSGEVCENLLHALIHD